MGMSSSSFSECTDEELARLHLSGDKTAFQSLVERYAKPLYGYARRLTGNSADAEDIAQETFLRFYQNLPKLALDQPFKPWLFRVCTNLCRNHAKRKKSLPFSQLAAEDEEDASIVEQLPDAAPTPHQNAESSGEIQQVRSAIDAAPEHYQTVLKLYYWDQLSYEEIARVLSLPINTVRTHLRGAREYLQRPLQHLL